MRVVRKTTMLAMAAAVCMVAGSPAQAAIKDSGVVDASKRIAGFTADQLVGEEFRQILELPPDANPLLGNGDNCLSAGHKDKVLILWTTPAPAAPTVCNVKPGTPVFFSTIFAECSSVEPPPFFGATEEEQRQCVLAFLQATRFDTILVSIDGGPPVNIGLDRFLAVSGQGTVELPDPNILGVPGNRQATFVAGAYSALVRSLTPGSHTITVTIVGGDFAGTNRAVVNVVPGLKS
jgi:hypothetical protein